MSTRTDFDRRLGELLHELEPARVPDYADDVRAVARTRPQRPAWTFPGRWLGIDLGMRPPSPIGGVGWIALLVLLLLAAVAVVSWIGSRPRLPAPLGPAANGFIVYDDGAQIRLTRPDGGDRALTFGPGVDTRPSLSPDGQWLAFLREQGSRTSLMVARADGGGEREVAATDSSDRAFITLEAPVWSPGSDRIAVTVINESTVPEHAEIWIVDALDGGHSVLLPPALFAAQLPTWSPDGTRIAFLGEPAPRAEAFLYVAAVDGTGLIRLSNRASGPATGYFGIPRWRLDGALIAVHHGDPGDFSRDVLLLATDRIAEEVVVGSDRDEAHPIWSPDGRQLAFWRSTASSGEWLWQVVVLDLQTRAEVLFPTASESADSIAWSPDGRSLTATRCESGASCELLLLDTMDPSAPPITVAELPPKSYDVSNDQAYWSWQRRAP